MKFIHKITTHKKYRFMFISVISLIGLILSVETYARWDNDESVLIQGGWLIDAVSDERRKNTGIIIQNGKIIAVDADMKDSSLTVSRTIDLSDTETILPGMIDMHAHYNFDLVDIGRVEEVIYNGIIFLANGVTSTWSAGEYYPERVIQQRDLIDAGKMIGPRLFASGPYFGAFRCEYNIKTAKDDCIAWPNDISEQEIRNEVNKWAQQGVISIKIKQASPGEAKILIEQAHKNGMTTAAHLANYHGEYDVDLRDAILMGLDRVEHRITLGTGGERSSDMDQMIELMIDNHVFYDPNIQMYGGINLRKELGSEMIWTDEAQYFTPYAQHLLQKRGDPPPESEAPAFNQRLVELKAFFGKGGGDLILVGTDEPVYTTLLPGFAYHRELYAMVYAGIPNMSVIRAATINGARALGVDDELGSIEVGKIADIIVIKGDPLSDIKSTRNIKFIMKEGVYYDPEILLSSAKEKIGPQDSEDHAEWELQIRPLRVE
jgi:imidazolonepropionase-like amidohydrolase